MVEEKTCGECGQSARRLRKQRCDACYMRLYRNGTIPEGAACGACGERRRVVLVRVTIHEVESIACGNCALILERTRPRITSIQELVRLAARERRLVPDRRRGSPLDVVPGDRRMTSRREGERAPEPRATLDPSID